MLRRRGTWRPGSPPICIAGCYVKLLTRPQCFVSEELKLASLTLSEAGEFTMNCWLTRLFLMAVLIVCPLAGPSVAQIATSGLASRSGLPADFDQVFTRSFAEANGVRLHYVIGGPADGEMVVLLHGWPQTWYTWRRVMPALAAAGYRVVAVDYRGAGESERPLGGYDKATMAADVRALVGQLGRTRINLVGRDIGVMVAYAYTAQWPDEVARLVMLDVPVPATRAWNEAKSKSDPQLWHFGLHQQRDIAEMLITGREYAYISDFYKKRAHVPVADEDIAVYARAYAAPGGLRAGFELYRAFPDDERRFAQFMTNKLPMPVLALAGDRSNGQAEVEMAKELASDVRGGVAPDTGHWLPDENPEYLSKQLIAFFGGTTTPGGQRSQDRR